MKTLTLCASLAVAVAACVGGPRQREVPVCSVDSSGAVADAALSGASLVDSAEIDRVVAELLAAESIPGLTVAVCTMGADWSRGYGMADLENDVPATVDTIYRLASISKPITAVALMQLVEAGALELDATVESCLPRFAGKRWSPTLRQVLSHLGGVRHYMRPRESQLNRHFDNVEAALETFADDPLLHAPGAKYKYSTFGFNLLGAVVQRAAAAPFADVLRRKVFEPAGATTLQVDDAWKIIPHRAQGYRLSDGQLLNAYPVDTSNKVPGGGLCGTALDVARFGRALLDDRLLTPNSRTQMWTAAVDDSGDSVGYGLGFGVRGKRDAGTLVVGHSGSQPRVQTLLRIWPKRGVVVALMCNRQGAKLGAAVDAIAKTVEIR